MSVSDGSRSASEFDVLVWGATSSTGRLVAEYLARHYGVGRDLRWALGGRNQNKLEQIRAELLPVDARAGEIPLLIGDAQDAASLDALVPRARVVATTVGPYALYGREMVAACTRHGVDYCDLTGEVPFMRDMIESYHAEALETGARIVPACGFDSIPSDLGVWMMQEYMRKQHGGRCLEVKYIITDMRGGVGGGTAATMINMFEEATRNPEVRKVIGNPYALDPGRIERGPDGMDQLGVRWDADLNGWTGPFVMAGTNTRVVRRTNALLEYRYGKDFRYSEVMGFSSGAGGWLSATGWSLGMAAFTMAAVLPPTRWMIKQIMPAPGKGPSKEVRERGFFKIQLFGQGESASGAPVKLRGMVAGPGDPGHSETAKMMGESAVCLARDRDGTRQTGGVLTPAATMGDRLLERLRAKGMTFTVEEANR